MILEGNFGCNTICQGVPVGTGKGNVVGVYLTDHPLNGYRADGQDQHYYQRRSGASLGNQAVMEGSDEAAVMAESAMNQQHGGADGSKQLYDGMTSTLSGMIAGKNLDY